ncbi:MAG: DUF3142 domain-containing protein [Verrucomicrobiae bacterium]|nr:DUF3142 domain-containing protein [Verrucomicrobiae bacterium]
MHHIRCLTVLLALLGAQLSAWAEPLPHQAYVWQRAWTPPVCAAVAEHASNFIETAVLLAEVSWKNKLPQVARAKVDFPTLAKVHCPVGLVLRVGAYGGALAENGPAVDFLAELAGALAAEARAGQVDPVELQIDFDCPESKLDDYCGWLKAVQRRVAPLPVTITALPSWLDSPAFTRLAAAATNYILQAHSLVRPTDIHAPFTLCDPEVARRAVIKAGAIGVPFRVALPTYTYVIAFNAAGKFTGLSAESPRLDWPEGTQIREMKADPQALSSLVKLWSTNRPSSLGGVIWYRLPVAVDNLNWRWPTLGAIVAGREPREKFHADARRVEAGLVEISLVNDGELDISSRIAVEARWTDARLIAGDGLRGFEMAEQNNSAATFQNNQSSYRLPAGETQIIGWLRCDHDREVQLEVKKY